MKSVFVDADAVVLLARYVQFRYFKDIQQHET